MVTAEAAQAAAWVSDMIRLESRGPGDTNNAMRRIARRYQIPFPALFSLRYRSPRRVWADIYAAVRAARDEELQKHIGRLQHDLEITRAIAGPNDSAVRAVEALVVAHTKHGEAP
ncbi:hypothetical protein [Methylobacterium oryzisoli]|uniref:hypothetical protein n=1 Tax=Methylobacterium oryzisoli TaxID=3385502 RepID=UPI00389203F1